MPSELSSSYKADFTKFLGYFYGTTISLSLLLLSGIFFGEEKTGSNPLLIFPLAIITFIYFIDDTIQLHQINTKHPYDWNVSFRRLICDVLIVIFFYFSLSALKANNIIWYKIFLLLVFIFCYIWADKLKEEIPFEKRDIHFASAYKFLYGIFVLILVLCVFGSFNIVCSPERKILNYFLNILNWFGNDYLYIYIFLIFYIIHDVCLLIFRKYKSHELTDFPIGIVSRIILKIIGRFSDFKI